MRNGRLIYTIANGFGHLGPDRTEGMTDQYAQAGAGLRASRVTPAARR